MSVIPELDTLLRLARLLHPGDVPDFLGELEKIRATAWTRLTVPPVQTSPSPDDELIDVTEASRRLGVSRSYLYQHHSRFPFTRRVGRSLRFSIKGIENYIQRSGVLTPRRHTAITSVGSHREEKKV
jgi:predicted DNA-binding transcriptional regulator AlpA